MRLLTSLTLLVVFFVAVAGCSSGGNHGSGGSGTGGSPPGASSTSSTGTSSAGTGGAGTGGSGTGGSGTGGAPATTTSSSTSTTSTTSTGGTGGSAPDGGDPCSPNPCTQPNQTQCQNQGGMAVCSCDPGTHLQGGACVPDATCMPTTCGGNGICTPVDGGTVSCTCDTGWAPPFCSTCATGYHGDGMGGCTTDPCLPDPCTAAHKTTCTAVDGGTACSCDMGYHDDGMGGCTNDPCTPNPCAAQNQACQVVGGQVTCVTPNCDDGNPCTTDTVVQGACVHTPVADGTPCGSNPCLTGQTCKAGTCSGGSVPSCDDGDPCTTDACVSGTGCTHTPAAAGTPCDDGIACTTGDACNAQGACAGTVTPACTATTCSGTTPLGGTVDIPVAQTSATITLGGQPLPAMTEYGSSSTIYLVAKDTGQWHVFATFDYTTTTPNGTLYGPTVNPRVVPGIYDVVYCHNCALSTTTTDVAYETDAGDAFPNGLRVLQSNVVVGAGVTHLDIDIPVAQTSATVTLGGQPLPAMTEYGSSSTIYLVAKDTGQWHVFATFDYTTTTPNGTLYGPTVNPRVVSGTYDVVYCHDCALSGGSVPVAYETDAADAFPNGLRVLQSNVAVGPGATHLAIDIPVAQTTATVTLGGQPLPAMTEYGSSSTIYLVAKDTGQWHVFATFDYTTTTPNGTLYGPTINPLVVPGTYDVYYCHNCALSTTTTDVSYETDASDAFPNGLRILQSGVAVGAGAVHLAVDIPVTPLAESVTLSGKPLPAMTEYGSSSSLYLVAKDTGQWHVLATFDYTTTTPNGTLYGPTIDPRAVSGAYDVYYCHNCALSGGAVPVSYETDAADAFPNGLRILRSCVTVP